MLLTALTAWLIPILTFFSDGKPRIHQSQLHFELRHRHTVSTSAKVLFADIPKSHISSYNGAQSSYSLKTRKIKSYRPSCSFRHGQCEDPDWEEEEIIAPDVESRETLLELAKMTHNAYTEVDNPRWYDLGANWTSPTLRIGGDGYHPILFLWPRSDVFCYQDYQFGWESDADGFRGHVFATPDNSTIVLAIKGTTSGFFGGSGPTSKKDKFNDNLLFSCCCARVDWTWTTVCGCYRGGWKCEQNCLEEALIEESLFFPIGTNLYSNLTYMYPNSTLWIIGHSLGGALASLLGTTFGAPVVTFECPGEKMAAQRLHLPSPPSTQHVTHVYHTADPIAMGTCNGILSSCALGGYAMESRCHLGKTILYDTVTNLSWSVDIRTHGIVNVIERILSEPWAPSVEVGREVPLAKAEEDCVECYNWDFGDYPP